MPLRVNRRAARAGIAALALVPGLLLPLEAQDDSVTEQAVREHVERLKSSLLGAQQSDGSWPQGGYTTGMTALAVMALLHAGLPADHPTLRSGLEYIAWNSDGQTYSESLVICALELAGPEKYRPRIQQAVDSLVRGQGVTGSWSYNEGRRGTSYDNSNTQFAVLGLAAAERCGIEVPKNVKKKALDHWLLCKSRDGGWSYYSRSGSSTLSMTCAGIASLHLLGRKHEKPRDVCGEYEYDEALQKGIKAMLRHIGPRGDADLGSWPSYTLYAIERVGMFLDLKEIEGLDWYRWGAAQILRSRGQRGLPDTALDLLFIARGEAQVALAKWRHGGDWNNDHQDLKNWTAFANEDLKMKLDWIPARLDKSSSPAGKASAIFASGHGRLSGSDLEGEFLRDFLSSGGTLIAEACCGSEEFAGSFREFVRAQLFPGIHVEFVPIPPGHPVCQQKYNLTPEEVSAVQAKTGCQRRRVLLFTRDFSCALNGEPCDGVETARARKVAVNLLQWAMRSKTPLGKLAEVETTGKKARALRPGEDEVQASPAGASRKLRQPFGRLIHRGEWDADLAFFPTLKGALAGKEGLPVFDGEVFVKPGSGDLFACPVLFVAGHGDPKLRDEEWLPLRTYLQVGGTIVASACCGYEEFDAGFRRLLASVLPNDRLEEIPASDILWKTPFPRESIPADGSKAFLSQAGKKLGPLFGVRREGRWIVIYSPVDLCCDLEGDLDEECRAYKKAASIPLWANILRYAITP